MCGFVGVINYGNKISVEDITLQLEKIKHRGPDESDIISLGNVIFGFNRLSIIDLKGGHQPMVSKTFDLMIIFNGEIYNYNELRKSLEEKGVSFNTKSDTEVIIKMYEFEGESFVKKLRGMFSFAIYDFKNQVVFCARDNFGIKPFYYYLDNDCVIFGSELKSISSNRNISLSFSANAIDNYFTFGYIPKEFSIYKEVKKLQAGHTIKFSLNKDIKPVLSKFWEPSFSSSPILNQNVLVQKLDETLLESVSKHLISDVPVGAFLSGGIDSSIVVAMASKLMKQPIKTFSIGFKDKKFNELPFARIVSTLYNTDHHELILEPEDLAVISKITMMTDEPFADSSILPTYYVSKFASEYVKVVLSGDGGDELFGGYNMYDKMLKVQKYNFGNEFAFIRNSYNQISNWLPYSSNYKRLAYFLSQDKNKIAAYTSLWTKVDRESLYNIAFKLELGNYFAESESVSLMRDGNRSNFLDRAQIFNMQFVMVDDILTKVDRASMLNSLEVRVPILDLKVAEISSLTPQYFRINGKEKKFILKKVAERYLPNELIYRKKQGFSVPLNKWFKENLFEYIYDEIINSTSPIFNYINKEFVISILNLHKRGKVDYSSHIWSLLIFHNWLNNNKL